jgi:hypothetical protein
MTEVVTIRMPARLARQLRAKARAAKTTPSAVLRGLAGEYVRRPTGTEQANPQQEHIAAYAGAWDGYCSGEQLLKKTRPYDLG